MKGLVKVAILLGMTQTVWAHEAAVLAYDCHGKNEGHHFDLQIKTAPYDGTEDWYKHNAEFELWESGPRFLEHNIYTAHGGATTECGSRSSPCRMIEIVSFSSANVLFHMISDADSASGQGTLEFYDNGFDHEATKTVELFCAKHPSAPASEWPCKKRSC